MASNTNEVLDGAAAVEQIGKAAARRALSRRNFMTAIGAASAATGAVLMSKEVVSPKKVEAQVIAFSQSDVLNFALNLEYLEATFYSYVTQGTDLPPSVTIGSGAVTNPLTAKLVFTGANAAQITDMLNEIYFDELNHVLALRSVLGSAAVPRPAINLAGYATVTATNALSIARLLEDVGVTAYTGAAASLSGANLAYAAQILAVEGFHSGALRLAAIQNPAIAAYLATQNVRFYGTLVTGSAIVSNITINGVSTTSGLVVGQTVSATGITANSTISAINAAANTITISSNATATTAANAFVAFTDTTPGDGFDVQPADPGTAASSATGPSTTVALTSSPVVYKGFFNTTNASNASQSQPLGTAFQRTASQVLQILYGTGGVPVNTGVGSGGFFPSGVTGNIKTV
jgi:hypothetical protein